MDSNQARDGPARQVHSEHTLTAYHQGLATEVGAVGQPSASASSLDPWTFNSSHLDSQSRSLRQASLALDTAYERITHIRNSINNLLNRMPPEITGTSTSTTNTSVPAIPPRRSLPHDSSASLRPPHSVLVLSDQQTVEDLNQRAARLRSLIPASARQRLEEFESTSGNDTRREFVRDTFSRTGSGRGDVHLRVPQPRTPPMPDIVVPRTRDHVDTRAAQRRDLQSVNRDDSSTMIGRRVAARLSSESHGGVSTRPSLSQMEQRLQAETAEIAQELENMTDRLATQRSRRVERAPSSARRGNSAAGGGASASTPSSGIWASFAPVDVSGDVRSRPFPPNGGRPLRPPRDIVLDNTTRIHPPQSISRTSSNALSLEDFVTPTTRRSLSAAYREHIANVSQDSPRNLASTPEVRGTLVNLLTRERDDQFLAARRVDPRLGGDANRRDDLSARSHPSPQAGQTRRRRGWTRLNADGDEIDSDEDDNMSLPTRRLRMRVARGNTSVDSSSGLSNTITIEDILWRTSGSDSEPDALSPDATESSQSLFQSSPPPATVHYPNPLPTPVEEMLEYPTVRPPQKFQTVRVSKYASLAGR